MAKLIENMTEAEKEVDKTRAFSYPSITEQLDLIWHAIDADEDLKVKFANFYNAIKTVKDNNPK
jgi:hypothetical protein